MYFYFVIVFVFVFVFMDARLAKHKPPRPSETDCLLDSFLNMCSVKCALHSVQCTVCEFHNFSFDRSDEQVCYMYLYLWLCFILFSKCIFTCISCICIPVCVPYKMLFEDHPRMDGAGFNLQPCLGFWVDFSALASQSRISQSKAPTTGQPILSVRTPFGPLPASETVKV